MVEKILRSLTDTFENMICVIEESDNLTELSVDELVGSLLAHEQRKKNSRRKNLSRRSFKQRWFSKRRHCMYRRHNMHASEKVVDDVAGESRASRVNRAQTRQDEGAKMATADENPIYIVTITGSTSIMFNIAKLKRK
jgi:gag-polypeptide of LTR copia-type